MVKCVLFKEKGVEVIKLHWYEYGIFSLEVGYN